MRDELDMRVIDLMTATLASFEPDYLDKLRTEVQNILARPDFAEKLNVSGSLEPLILSPVDFGGLILSDYEKYGKLIKQIGIKAD